MILTVRLQASINVINVILSSIGMYKKENASPLILIVEQLIKMEHVPPAIWDIKFLII